MSLVIVSSTGADAASLIVGADAAESSAVENPPCCLRWAKKRLLPSNLKLSTPVPGAVKKELYTMMWNCSLQTYFQ